MGIRLVRETQTFAFPIIGDQPRTRLILIHMAAIAHDNHNPPWYGQGWEDLARAAGYTSKPTTQQAAVSRQLANLTSLNIIHRSYHNHDGTHRSSRLPARWILHLGLWEPNN